MRCRINVLAAFSEYGQEIGFKTVEDALIFWIKAEQLTVEHRTKCAYRRQEELDRGGID